jgi:2-polyprenyl-6-methoxyphenol hydroxylase-like FAD-dependent oxidoreductase
MSEHYDVIIVGGRVAGASLAMRLAQQNLKILLIDRAGFPSWPAVPSSPVVHPGTMRLLDELGLAEEEYTHPNAKATHMIMDMMGKFQAILPMSLMELDRNYIFGIDRNKFDTVLWERAAALPTVTACQNFAMTDVVKDADGRVTGIIGRPTNSKTKETISADLVVGADGRFSMAARKFGSQPFEEFDYPSASYHAEWEGVAPYSKECPQPLMAYQLGGGYFLLGIPVDKQKYIIANYLRTADTHFNGQKLEDHYHEAIESVPRLHGMLKDARRVTPVVGIRRIDNGYRQAYGDGWALVGDAFHYESPIDLQGIYNALLASRFLAEAIEQWRNGRSWLEAGKEYQQRFYDSSHDMLKQTVARLKQELYTPTPPPFVINHLMRWVLTDPAFQKKYLLYLSRAIDPNSFAFAPSPGPLARGLLRDIFRVRPLRFEPA